MKFFFLLLNLFLYNLSLSQDLPKVVPLSPEASSLFKFNESPVSMFTGTHNTLIPLYEINLGTFSLPIHLSYHSKGIQVNEIASSVGTGWSLNYGGMISRQIRGIADESSYGYFLNQNSKPSYYNNLSTRHNEMLNETIGQNDCEYDYFPDKYMINTNFFTGEFYFDKNNNAIITQNFSDIVIIKTMEGFKVIQNDGTIYIFNTSEVEQTLENYTIFNTGTVNSTNNSNSSLCNELYPSSWYLTQIITTENEIINFEYENDYINLYRRTGDNYFVNGSENFGFSGMSSFNSNYKKVNWNQKRLKKINFSSGYVFFEKQINTRLDLNNAYAIEKMEVYNSLNQKVKSIIFNYTYTTDSYFTSPPSTTNPNVNWFIRNIDLSANYRLFLNSLEIKDVNSTSKEMYSFEYYNDYPLPNRHSNEVDIFGYYNKKSRGQYLNYYLENEDVILNNVVDEYVKSGLLKKLIYPSGGYTKFEYEPNNLQFYSIDENIELPISMSSQRYISFSNINYTFNNSLNQYESYPFQINFIPSEKINYDISITNGQGCADVNNNQNCAFRFYLRNNDTNQLKELFYNPLVPKVEILSSGSYSLILKCINPNINFNPSDAINHSFLINLTWTESLNHLTNDKHGPGNRIKTIYNYDTYTQKGIYKYYQYKDQRSTGYLISYSNFKVKNGFVTSSSSLPNSPFNSYQTDIHGYTKVSEYLIDSNLYSNNLTESQLINGSIHKKTFHYTLIPDFGNYFSEPFHPVSNNDWLRGKLLFTEFFEKKNNIFVNTKTIENQYIIFNNFMITKNDFSSFSPNIIYEINPYLPLQVAEIEKPCIEQNFNSFPYLRNRIKFAYPYSTGMNNANLTLPSGFFPCDIGYRTIFLNGGTLDLKKTIETDYFNNQNVLSTTTENYYNYNNHYNIIKTSTTTSTGDVLETNFSYAHEMNNQAMISKNMVNIPLKTETKRNGTVISTQETKYKDWNPDATEMFLAPELIQTSKGTNPLETRVKYNKYDEFSNPLEVQQEGGMLISYIWGYNNTQPVAKLENIAYDQIPSNLIAAIQQATDATNYNEQNVVNALNALRTSTDANMQKAMITTYVYKPLVGVTKITDPKGDTQTFLYDTFNRLKEVRDKDNNLLQESEYWYRTQN